MTAPGQRGLRGRHRGPLVVAAVPTVLAASLGNAFISRDALRWFRQLRKPRFQIPYPAFYAVGAVYYVQVGTVLYRARQQHDTRAVVLSLTVLFLNEAYNVAFFGRRSVRNGFLGTVVFLVPLCALQAAIARDRASVLSLTPYTAWVVAYDVPWTYGLWRLNR